MCMCTLFLYIVHTTPCLSPILSPLAPPPLLSPPLSPPFSFPLPSPLPSPLAPPPLPSPLPSSSSPVQPQRGDQTLQSICQQLYNSDANLREGNQEEDKICHIPPTKVQPEQDQPQSAGPPPQTDPEISSVHSLPAGKIVALTTSSFSSSFFLLLLLLTSISSFYVSCLCKGFLPLHHLMS